MKFYLAIVKILLTTLLTNDIHAQQPFNQLNAYLITANSTVQMVSNNVPNSSFIEVVNFFDCSLSSIYSYTQSNTQYLDNTPYSIAVTGITQNTLFSFSTIHNNFVLSYEPTFCNTNCQITIQNNCPQNINFQNYFDRIVLNISGYPQLLSYYVKCNQ